MGDPNPRSMGGLKAPVKGTLQNRGKEGRETVQGHLLHYRLHLVPFHEMIKVVVHCSGTEHNNTRISGVEPKSRR